MDRRGFLAAAAGCAVSGCLGAPGDGTTAGDAAVANGGTGTERSLGDRPAKQSAVETVKPEATDGRDPVVTATVGDGVGPLRGNRKPHALVVWNDGPEREVGVRVRGSAGGPDYDWSGTIPEGATLSLELTERTPHRVVVGVAGETDYWLDLSADLVDCNHSRTTVRIAPDGSVSYGTVSTTMGCGRGPI